MSMMSMPSPKASERIVGKFESAIVHDRLLLCWRDYKNSRSVAPRHADYPGTCSVPHQQSRAFTKLLQFDNLFFSARLYTSFELREQEATVDCKIPHTQPREGCLRPCVVHLAERTFCRKCIYPDESCFQCSRPRGEHRSEPG